MNYVGLCMLAICIGFGLMLTGVGIAIVIEAFKGDAHGCSSEPDSD